MDRKLLSRAALHLLIAAVLGGGLSLGCTRATRRLSPTITTAALSTMPPPRASATPVLEPRSEPTETLEVAPDPGVTPTRTADPNAPPPPLTVEHPASPSVTTSATLTIHTEPGVDVFVTSESGTFQVASAIPDGTYTFAVELLPDTVNHFVVAVRRTYEPYAGAQKNYDLLGEPLLIVQGQPPPTPTPAPIWTLPPRPSAPPPPSSGDVAALADYLVALQPMLEEGLAIAERDAVIVEESDRTKNDALLCDGRLVADAMGMEAVVARIRALAPAADASEVHRLLLESGTAWADALAQIGEFCRTGNQLYKVPAILRFWEAALKFQDAANRFWALVAAKGLEAWIDR